ncbi:MAG: GNAT family N-acetyltransferase [Candidatus Lokiarchaeota archaeon]|nr:GNAT family N-acetyltransferase [Candidatus Lokiarchaeota archaeon]
MIFEIGEEDIPKLEAVAQDYVQNHHDESLTLDRIINYLKQVISSGGVYVMGHKTNEMVDGFILMQKHGEISAYHVKADNEETRADIERLLFSSAIDKLKDSVEAITYSDSKGISSLRSIFEEAEFESYDRASMYVSKEDIKFPEERNLPEEYELTDFSLNMNVDLAEVVYDANKGQVDSKIYHKYFGSEKNAEMFVEKFAGGAFGKYKEGLAKVILYKSQPVAACFMVLATQKTAAVSELAVGSKHKRKGLGTKVLVESIKTSFELPDVEEIGLHVTLSNPAKQMYDKFGFIERYQYTIYVKNFT